MQDENKSKGWLRRALVGMKTIPTVTLWLFPELRRLEDDRTQKAVLRSVPSRHVWIPFVLPSVVILILLFAPIHYSEWRTGMMLAGLFAGVAPFGIAIMFARPKMRRAIRRELVRRGIPICVHCGYDTRNLTENRCPECGKGFDPIEAKP